MEYSTEARNVHELHATCKASPHEQRSRDYAGAVAEGMRLEITHLDEDEVEFDLSGVDVSFANALRRIMLSEVPTMAIETVYVEENAGVIQDEVLAHRLGLIPIRADPNDFEELHDIEDATDANTIVFGLEVRAPPNTRPSRVASARLAKRDPGDPLEHEDSDDSAAETAPGGHRHTTRVTSGDLAWLPQGEQEAFLADRPVKPVHDDILITKLRPGQAVALEAHGRKGIARDHAKFSPVATAAYRLFPRLDVRTSDPPPYARGAPPPSALDGTGAAPRSRPLPATLCANCAPVATPRPEACATFAADVKLKRVSDHFLFKVESAGQLPPLRIVRDAIAVLKKKCDTWRRELELNGGHLSAAPPRPVDAFS